MAAQDNLSPDQFSTWYHGTTRDKGESIAREGLRSDSMGLHHGRPYYTLASHADEAAMWAGKGGSLVTVHMPDDKAPEYLTSDPHATSFMGPPRLSGIHKPIPPDMLEVQNLD